MLFDPLWSLPYLATSQVADSKDLASARMRVRSVAPYLEEAQRDIFTGKWKFVQGYLGVIFSQVRSSLSLWPPQMCMPLRASCV